MGQCQRGQGVNTDQAADVSKVSAKKGARYLRIHFWAPKGRAGLVCAVLTNCTREPGEVFLTTWGFSGQPTYPLK